MNNRPLYQECLHSGAHKVYRQVIINCMYGYIVVNLVGLLVTVAAVRGFELY